MSLLAALALAAAPGCDFNLPRYQLPEAGVPSDGPPPDAMSCEPNTITCDDAAERYVDCGPDGSPEVEIQCPLGCSTEREYCLDVAPSNGLAGFLDQARDDELVVDVVFTGASTIDTDSGDVVNAGVPIEVPIGISESRVRSTSPVTWRTTVPEPSLPARVSVSASLVRVPRPAPAAAGGTRRAARAETATAVVTRNSGARQCRCRRSSLSKAVAGEASRGRWLRQLRRRRAVGAAGQSSSSPGERS